MRFLVTGASGHLGAAVTRRLVGQGHEVAILVRPTSDLWRIGDLAPRLRIVHGDLARIDEAAGGIAAVAPEAVIHVGWSGVAGADRDGEEQIRHNLLGTLRLVDLARDAGCGVWVGIGSQAEYGPAGGVLDEDTPVRPVSRYGVSKLCAGLLTRELCAAAGMRHLWLRLLATYGPADDPRFLIPSTIARLLAGERPALTRGEQRWDYLFVDDAAEAICRAALERSAVGTFVLGSGTAHSVREIVERIRDVIDPSLPLGFGEVPERPGQPGHLQADIGRLQRAIGWRPRVSLDEGLARTVAWYRGESEETSEPGPGGAGLRARLPRTGGHGGPPHPARPDRTADGQHARMGPELMRREVAR